MEINNIDLTIIRYSDSMKTEWDYFVQDAKNHLFMFERNYMDYHSDRFEDFSMMFYRGGKMVAVMPANIKDNILYSHGGLTYGGLVVGNDIKQYWVNEVFDLMLQYLRELKINKLYYKTIPHIFYKQSAEEDRYALFQHGATVAEVTASTVVNLSDPLKMSHDRKNNINRAKRNDIIVKECHNKIEFASFFELENAVLQARHGVKAVHSSDEMYMLYTRFPKNIHLICAYKDNEIIAGSVIYEYDDVIHTQYMAAGEMARKNGALDLVISHIIDKYKGNKKWLDFGISTEDGGRYLNKGLISQKEGFGGRTLVYELWEINIH